MWAFPRFQIQRSAFKMTKVFPSYFLLYLEELGENQLFSKLCVWKPEAEKGSICLLINIHLHYSTCYFRSQGFRVFCFCCLFFFSWALEIPLQPWAWGSSCFHSLLAFCFRLLRTWAGCFYHRLKNWIAVHCKLAARHNSLTLKKKNLSECL